MEKMHCTIAELQLQISSVDRYSKSCDDPISSMKDMQLDKCNILQSLCNKCQGCSIRHEAGVNSEALSTCDDIQTHDNAWTSITARPCKFMMVFELEVVIHFTKMIYFLSEEDFPNHVDDDCSSEEEIDEDYKANASPLLLPVFDG